MYMTLRSLDINWATWDLYTCNKKVVGRMGPARNSRPVTHGCIQDLRPVGANRGGECSPPPPALSMQPSLYTCTCTIYMYFLFLCSVWTQLMKTGQRRLSTQPAVPANLIWACVLTLSCSCAAVALMGAGIVRSVSVGSWHSRRQRWSAVNSQ